MTYFREPMESWGRVLRAQHEVARPSHIDQLPGLLTEAQASFHPVLGVGLNRSYGDSGLNPHGGVISARGLDRFIAFDPVSGVLRAEAGVSLGEIAQLTVPKGWFLPTTPGTSFVTLGGAIANDVHGKNHHRAGSFGCHVRRIGLLRSDMGWLDLDREGDPDLFHATLGGLGLTGLIGWAEIDLIPIGASQMLQESIPFDNLDAFFALSAQSEADFEHISAWIDCTATGDSLGRGVLFRANWQASGELRPAPAKPRISLPFEAPPGLMNSLTLKALNSAYLLAQTWGRGASELHYGSTLYPLDSVGGWNRLYGPRGFYQHQFVAPTSVQHAAMTEALQAIARSGQGSFLVVLKTLGPRRSGGLLSFHGPGASLALDFPNRGDTTLALMNRLDDIAVAAGGRIYPAKDGRMSPSAFKASYPNWETLEHRRDPLFSSHFWNRVTQ